MSTLTKTNTLPFLANFLTDLQRLVSPPLRDGLAKLREAYRAFGCSVARFAAELVDIARARAGVARATLELGEMRRIDGLSFPIAPSRFPSFFDDDEALGILKTAIERHLARELDESETFYYVPLYSCRDHWLDHWGWRWNQGKLVAIYERGDERLAIHLELEAPCGYNPARKGEQLGRWRREDYRTIIKSGSVRNITYEEDPPF